MNRSLIFGFSFLVATLAVPRSHAAPPPWAEILTALPPARLPAATATKVVWRSDLAAALAEAKRQNRPVFVTLRCLPCKQCADFDKAVLEGGPELDPHLLQFITVRLTDAKAIDLRILPVEGYQDLDLSWWGWFLSPDAQIYGIYGGKDHVSDATRISKESLIRTMERVLQHHHHPQRPQWNVEGAPPDLRQRKHDPADLPGFQSWTQRGGDHVRKQTCIHCHQVNDILRQPAIDAKTFDKQRDVQVWPFPENVGLVLDRDDGLRVNQVTPGSPAVRAGLQAGDSLGAAGGRRLFGQADFRGVLHRGPKGAGSVEVWWTRAGQPMSGTLHLDDGWRQTNLDWRMSISQGNIGAGPGFFPLNVSVERRRKLGLTGLMAIEPYTGNDTSRPGYRAGLRSSHVVTAVDGQSPDLTGRGFLVWFRQRYDPGDQVTFTVLDEQGGTRQVTYALPAFEP